MSTDKRKGGALSFNRLSYKFLIPLSIVFLIVLGSYTVYLVNDFYQEQERIFVESFEQYLQVISSVSAGYLWNYNFDELEENLEYFFVNQELYQLTVVDDRGEVVVSLERDELNNGGLMKDTEDIYYDDLYLGELEMAFTDHYYHARVNELRNQLLILSIIIFGSLFAVIWYTSKRFITDPVHKLSDKLQQFAAGNFDNIPPSLIPDSIIARKDELGILGRAFDRMSHKLRKMINDLEDQQKKLKEISYHDILTGLYNRTFLEEEINRLDTARQLPISIIMADINGLKLINDTYGHEKGDELLVKTSEILTSSIRSEDLVARWAGDEFVILLPQTSKEEAGKVYNRIKTQCKECNAPYPISLGMGMAVKTSIEQDIYEVLNEADDKMYQNKLTESRSAKSNLVSSLLSTLEAKSHETTEHANRIEKLAIKMGEQLGLSDYDLHKISLLSTLHDIGKTTVPQKILIKPGKLTEEEWEIIKKHPERGYSIATSTKEFAIVAEEILYHHEHWDGSGYPDGLEGEEIPLLSRIISIVDSYDVMTNGRPYQEAISREEALEELRCCAGSQFDPELVRLFMQVV